MASRAKVGSPLRSTPKVQASIMSPSPFKPTTTPKAASTKQAAILQSSLAKLPPSSLAELCQRLRVQLVQQRLPLVCSECRPSLVRTHHRKMELNLTQMLRGLCNRCRSLFTASQVSLDKSETESLGITKTKTIKAGKKSEGQLLPSNQPDLAPKSPQSPLRKGSITRIILKVSQNFSTLNQISSVKVSPKKGTPYRACSVFETMTMAKAEWCRYCGATSSSQWRAGPWGQRTLCYKHGSAYEGKSEGSSNLRLDLSQFHYEKLAERRRPVLQSVCCVCQRTDNEDCSQRIWACDGCPNGYHQTCVPVNVANVCSPFDANAPHWFCSLSCIDNLAKHQMDSTKNVSKGLKRTERALSEPTARRFAKRFDHLNAPPTPPPTPCTGIRKRRATSDLASEVMICFDSDAAIKRPALEKQVVFTPCYQLIAFPPLQLPLSGLRLDAPSLPLPDNELLKTHDRYEQVEKNTRLCHPEVLRSLATPPPPLSSGCNDFKDFNSDDKPLAGDDAVNVDCPQLGLVGGLTQVPCTPAASNTSPPYKPSSCRLI